MLFTNPIVCALGLFALADAQITLGSAGQYGVFAASTITNTGLTVIGAKIGLSPGTSITGFPPGLNDGEDISNAAAVAAAADLQTAYNALAALPVTTSLTGQDLGGKILTAGVYNFASSGGLTGILTLDAQGDPNAVFVFQFGSTLTTATASSVILINGALPCNVFWQVGSSATLGTATIFEGNVIALASITATTGVSVGGGGLFAITAAVTLDTNLIDLLGACGGAATLPVSSIVSVATSILPVTLPTLPVSSILSVVTSILDPPPVTVTATQPQSTVTTTSTSTITDPASTTTLTVTVSATVTVTQTVATSYTTATSTSTHWSTKSATHTAKATACPKAKRDALEERANKPSTKTKTVTTTCAGHTSIHTAKAASSTKTVKATCTSTSTVWHTTSATTTHTSTKTPACTAKAKRDYLRMFE